MAVLFLIGAVLIGAVLSILSGYLGFTPYVGYALTVIPILFYFIKLSADRLWTEVEITLTPHVKDDSISPFGERMIFALLTVYNEEERPVTDCFATLEEATNLYGGNLIPIELGKKERLKWAEAKYSRGDCVIDIPAKD